jgi:Family of unknown function (DUF5985)
MSGALPAFFSGALTLGYLVAALFFLRYWRDSRDRLFLFFAGSFALLAVQRAVLALAPPTAALELPSYGLRLLAFVLILVAIADKNLRR